jgi:hypothetical protein
MDRCNSELRVRGCLEESLPSTRDPLIRVRPEQLPAQFTATCTDDVEEHIDWNPFLKLEAGNSLRDTPTSGRASWFLAASGK